MRNTLFSYQIAANSSPMRESFDFFFFLKLCNIVFQQPESFDETEVSLYFCQLLTYQVLLVQA